MISRRHFELSRPQGHSPLQRGFWTATVSAAAFVAVAVVALSGCELAARSAAQMRAWPLKPGGVGREGEAVVFGRMEFRGSLSDPGSWTAGSRSIVLYNADEDWHLGTWYRIGPIKADETGRANADHDFVVSLPPGRYAFTSYFETKVVTGYAVQVGALFTVPAGEKLIYLGTLTLSLNGGITRSVRSDIQQSTEWLNAEYPGIVGEPVEMLMTLLERRE